MFGVISIVSAVCFLLISLITYRVIERGPFVPITCSLARVNCIPVSTVEGTTTKQYEQMKQVYQEMFNSGQDIASCVAAYGTFIPQHIYMCRERQESN
jgi:hypothetical protein